METKKRVLSILNAVKNSTLDFYLNHDTIFKLLKKYWTQKLDKVWSKYSKHSKSVGEIEYCYDETIKHLKSEREEIIAERMKSNPQNKTGTGLKMLTLKKLLTRHPVFLEHTKVVNSQTNTVSFVSTQ